MQWNYLPFDAPLRDYDEQAGKLHTAWRAGDLDALKLLNHKLPRFLNEKIPWLARDVSADEIRNAPLTQDHMRMAVARMYDFLDWAALEEYVAAATVDGPVARFEAAVEAVIEGDAAGLETLLAKDPELSDARSTRRCCFDPPDHQATLLHYLAANGVESYRQRTPRNAVEIATLLLDAGADPNATARLYGGQCSVMSMLVSSSHPAEAGVQVPLIDLLVDRGASVEAAGSGNWASPLLTALVFGFIDAAEALVRRGAIVKRLDAAAGLGRLEDARRLLGWASPEERHRALALAAQNGRADVVALLLEAGQNPDRYNPPGCHAHATPLHHAALHGHQEVVRVLVEKGARVDMKDTTYHSTPAGWAAHAGHAEIAEFLRRAGG